MISSTRYNGKIFGDFRKALENEKGLSHLIVFDVCNTLFYSNTTLDFIEFVLRNNKTNLRLFLFFFINKKVSPLFWILLVVEKCAVDNLIRNLSITLLKGISKKQIYDFGKRFVKEYLPSKAIPQVHDMLRQAIGAKAEVYLISDSLDPVIRPLAGNFFLNYMAGELEFRDESFTGRLKPFKEKLKSVNKMREAAGYKRVTAISDNKSDRQLLETVDAGYAIVHKKRDRTFWQQSASLKQIWLG